MDGTTFFRSIFLGAVFVVVAGCAGGGSGDPPPPPPSPPSVTDVSFGSVTVGTTSIKTMTISGITGSISVGNLPALPAPFSIVNDQCSSKTVGISTSCTYDIRFAPTTTGPFSHSFDVPSDASNKITTNMSGTGVANGGGNPPPGSATPVIGSEARGLVFDSSDRLYISTFSGKLSKLEGGNISTFVPAGGGGLVDGDEIRFSQGHFYVQNRLNRTVGNGIDTVLLFAATGGFVREIIRESPAAPSDYFDSIAVNSLGQLYVVVANLGLFSLDYVARIDADGRNLATVVAHGDGGVFVPVSLAVDSKGNLYVGTPSVVSKFDANGIFLGKIVEGGIGTSGFEFASHLAVDRNDNLYVGNSKGVGTATNTWNVLKFNSSGVFQGEFVKAGAGGLGTNPDDMGFDSQGALYIADSSAGGIGGIARFTPAGSFDRVVAKNFTATVAARSLEDTTAADERARHYRELKELDLKRRALLKEPSQHTSP